MIHYSGSQWGNVPHPGDMSRMTLPDFTEALAVSLMNIHDACAPNGHYGVLMGNLRREGRYYNLSSLVERIAPGRLVDEIIKLQHQCSSDRKHYANSFVRIGHEKLLVFRKAGGRAFSMLVRIQRRVDNIVAATWRSAVRRALHGRSPVPLDQIYAAMEPYAMSARMSIGRRRCAKFSRTNGFSSASPRRISARLNGKCLLTLVSRHFVRTGPERNYDRTYLRISATIRSSTSLSPVM